MKKLIKTALRFILVTAIIACAKPGKNFTEVTQEGKNGTLYYGGDIITAEGGETPEYAEAVWVKDGKIAFVGNLKEAEKLSPDAERVDLNGKTMTPGFIDGHAHFAGFGAQAVTANLLASPDGKCNSMNDLIAELKDWHTKNGTDKTKGWILGMGFDDAVLKENRFPTREDLDKVSKDIPICVLHISGHFCVLNSKGLEVMNINAQTKAVPGGVIRRLPNSQEPNGVLEENTATPVIFKLFFPESKYAEYYMDKGQEMALSYGYTTLNEGKTYENHLQFVEYAKKGKLKLDLLSFLDPSMAKFLDSEWNSTKYTNHYRIGGLKITLDGSPQGRTAWRTIPYLIPPDGQKTGYKGYAQMTDEQVQSAVDLAYQRNLQIKAHCNGDAAGDQFIKAIHNAEKKFPKQDRRHIFIHGQLIRKDQIDSLAKYQIFGSFFPMHTFYWGDWYKKIIGDKAAREISPVQSALKKGVHINTHTDAPVALPNMMMILWTSINRQSRSGDIMGKEERLTPYQALKAITIWGAYEFKEENLKGSIKKGKLADLVILDQNPLKIDPLKIKDISVLQTIKEGKAIYTKK
ncbi:hydrolase [Cloacibacterium rupense]|uniref:Hydrolase n=1 Tax=Cloacibacterium rupense TaxID=517423 RepID=A0ABQ2NKG3_9FLAO|nr:amidohydrolase [Cloacibacterium rupense]GGP05112.1 hydrolase [Cloacibacterium rupense]